LIIPVLEGRGQVYPFLRELRGWVGRINSTSIDSQSQYAYHYFIDHGGGERWARFISLM
jgi:hypothetical protein